ncbi:MAG TPA: carboxypeptidase regulatory-like domain-containing protein [Blastocatellia bacterium]|nr:carboxypeptidase regulatory-like domain-containing protein [Blastocatellia bacterium]
MNRLLLIVLFITLAISAAAQSKPASAEGMPRAPRSRTITGRIIDQNNAPLEDATVVALPAGLTGMQQNAMTAAKIRPTSTDEQGRFTLDNLPSGSYILYADLAGYIALPDDNEGREQKYYRPGDTASIRMVKGGVITGTVTTMTGEPVINIKVNTIRLRDLKGRAAAQTSFDLQREFRTDDRGVYRIYGLLPGTYVILAGGRSIIPILTGAYDSDAPTFHPSSTRDTAAELIVHSGEEMAGVDIRYRDYAGHAVSGTVSSTGGTTTNPAMNIGVVTLSDVATQAFMGMAMAMLSQGGQGFQFDGVADGDYFVAATVADASAGSTPRRITVKGGDVTGVELAITPYASIAGRVVLESAPTAERKADCQPRRAAAVEETILLARAADRASEPSAKAFSLLPFPADSVPNNKGEFKIGHLDAGRHRVVIRFPSEDWYARSLKLPPLPPATEARDAALGGITLKAGEQLQGLTVTLAEGAAALRGRVIPATEGVRLPERLRLHLVPAEKEAVDNLLRYYEAELRGDSFELLNLAPGRYFVIARRAAEDDASDDSPRPVAWETEARKRLRQRAEAAEVVVELRPCQRVVDYTFKYAPAAKKKAEGGPQ